MTRSYTQNKKCKKIYSIDILNENFSEIWFKYQVIKES